MKKYTNYKLRAIHWFNETNKKTNISCFIAFKNQDNESYIRIFEYLKSNYGFSQKIVRIDIIH